MKDLKRLFGYMGPYRKDMALGMLLVVVESSFEMVIPVLLSDITHVGVARQAIPSILRTGLWMAVCALLCRTPSTAVSARWCAARPCWCWGCCSPL